MCLTKSWVVQFSFAEKLGINKIPKAIITLYVPLPITLTITSAKRKDGKYILHRVVKVCKDGTYTMRGDNQIYNEKGI